MDGGLLASWLLPRLLPKLPKLPPPPPNGLEGCWLLDKRVSSWSCNYQSLPWETFVITFWLEEAPQTKNSDTPTPL